MKVELTPEVIDSLLHRLYEPEHDKHERPIFALDPPLAAQLRLALHNAKEGATDVPCSTK